jgi:hypothetical protein
MKLKPEVVKRGMQRAVAVARHLAAAEASKSAGEAPRALGVGECAEKAQVRERAASPPRVKLRRADRRFSSLLAALARQLCALSARAPPLMRMSSRASWRALPRRSRCASA